MPPVYPLNSLLDVRLFREDKAKRDVSLAQNDVRAAREALEAREKERGEWKKRHEEEVERRYERLLGSTVTIRELNDFHRGLALMAARGLEMDMAVEKAEGTLKTCENKVVTAKDRAKAARQSAAKIEKHREIWREEAKKETERAEEREFEDFKPVQRLGAAVED